MGYSIFRVVVGESTFKRDRLIVRDATAHCIQRCSSDRVVLFFDTNHAHIKIPEADFYIRTWFKTLRVELLRGAGDLVLSFFISEF